MTTPSPRRIVVIGGGIAGLATSALLARDGHDVSLLEARSEVGGRAGRWEQDGFAFDTGPSWYLMPEVFEHFFRMLGTSADEQLDLVRLDPGYRVFFEDGSEAIDITDSRERNVAVFEKAQPGAGAALERYLDSAAATYRIALDRFLYTNFDSIGAFANPSVAGSLPRLGRLLLEPLDRLIARRFTDPHLRQILGYPAVFLGASPALAPSLFHLMSHLDLEEGVLYPRGGFRALIDRIARLARDAGVRISTDTRATRIETWAGRRPAVRAVRHVDADGVESTTDADIVVAAGDLHDIESSLLPAELRSYPEKWWSSRIAGPGAVLVMLGIRGRLPTLTHHNLLFTSDWGDNFGRIFGHPPTIPSPASIYVCRTSATDDDAAPRGDENLFILVPVPADPGIGSGAVGGAGDAAVEAVADEAIRQLASWSGTPDLAERIVVQRTVGPADFERDFGSWRGSALGPAHTLRQSAFLRGSNRSKRVDGLYFAGATSVPGIGLPMCLISAELVVKRIRGDRSSTPLREPA